MIANYSIELILSCLTILLAICIVVSWSVNRNRSGSLLLKLTQKNRHRKIILFLGIIQIIIGIIFSSYFLFCWLLYNKTNFQYIFSGINLFAIGLFATIKELSDIEIREHGILGELFFIKWNLVETYNWIGIEENTLLISHKSILPLNSHQLKITLGDKKEYVRQIILQYLPSERKID